MQSNKTLLLKGIRVGDFAALLALLDWYEEHDQQPRLQDEIRRYLRRAKQHVANPLLARRMGQSESMRRWTRDLMFDIAFYEHCWRGRCKDPLPRHNRSYSWRMDPYYGWCMSLARAALAWAKEQEEAKSE